MESLEIQDCNKIISACILVASVLCAKPERGREWEGSMCPPVPAARQSLNRTPFVVASVPSPFQPAPSPFPPHPHLQLLRLFNDPA